MHSRVLLSAIVTTASFLLIPSAVVMAQLRSYAFVPNLHSNNVTVISSPGNTFAATISVGASPTAAAVTPDGRRAYVVNESSNSVSVIDTSTRTVAATIPVGSLPVGIAITPDGTKAFVANSFSDSIDIIDTATNTVVDSRTPPGLDSPRAIAISPDGSTAYVTSQANGYVFPVDVATHAVGSSISVGQWPVAVAFTSDGTRAFVANYLSNNVSVIDVSSQTVIMQLPANSPSSVAVSPDGEDVYLANYLTNQVTVLNAFDPFASGTTISGFADPSGLAFTPDGRRLHVLNAATNSVAVLSIPNYLLVDNIPVGNTPASYTSTFIGPTTIIPSGGAFNVFGDGTLATEGFGRFINFAEGGTLRAMADLNLTRTVSLLGTDGGTIDTNGFNVTLAGNVINDGVLTKTGGGTLTLTGTSTHAGGTRIGPGGGTLVIDGVHTSQSVSVTGGTLGGSGTLGVLTATGGIVNPGAAAPGATGILHASNVSLHPSTALSIDIKGTTPGTGYDRLDASDTVFLNEASLGVSVGSFSTTPGQTFTILMNGIGAFGGLLEGTVLASLNHTDFFSISYIGGDGDDVVLTALDGWPSLAGLTTITIDEDAGVVSLPITVGHVFYGASSIAVTTQPPTNVTLVPAANVTVAGTGASRMIQITPRANAFGTTQISVQAVANGRTTSQSFLLHVNAVNDEPTISAIGAQSVPENTPLAPIAFTVGDIDTDAAELTITASSSNQAVVPDANLTIGGSGATRTIAAMPRTAVRGETIITVTVSDGTDSVSASFTLTVTEGAYYLAEGATGAFFDTDILLANPNDAPAPVVITFLTADGQSIVQTRTLPATSRTTIHAEDVDGLDAAMFSTIVTSTDALPLVVERTMRWDASGYGAHTEKATAGAAPTWYFAEGSTGFFSTFLLLANPHASANVAHVTYFREGEPELVRDYALAPGSRTTIDAWDEPELRNRSFGARVTFDLPGVAERAMYFGADPLWVGGHAAAGTTTPWGTWFFAEGATGSYFTTFLLLANPHDVPTDVTLTYYPESGIPVTKTDTIPARQRMTRNIALEDPSLANAAVATRVQSAWPIVAERSQYWGAPTWIEAHNSPGVAEVGRRWGLAEGRVGGSDDAQTYILLANPNVGLDPASVTITFLRADGTTIVKTFSVPSTSRVNVAVVPGEGNMAPELIDEPFGARIESTLPIVVERSVYSRANGVTWAAGTNATATRLP
jgi:YVTN family beta-propeller protein/autotransporter-associated beta strand protein